MSDALEHKKPNYRLVEKTALPLNPRREDFAEYLLFESGGMIMLDEGLIEDYDATHFKVPCYSFDGHSGPTHPTSAVFPNSGCLSDAEIDRQVRLYGDKQPEGWTPGIAGKRFPGAEPK